VNYLDMAMNLSRPHATDPYNKVGDILGKEQLEAHDAWVGQGLLALVGMGVEPGLSDVFARYASDHLFDSIDEIGVRDGANLAIEGYDFAPTFSIWTTIEECLNPPLVWEKERGIFTTNCFSEPEVFHFPEGIGPIECVNVEHEEVLLMPREIECNRVTFKYGLGTDFINWLKTFAYLGLHDWQNVCWYLGQRHQRWQAPRGVSVSRRR
jgi:saccharopine dehydrogenase-like NADP-dependent oxidoreductase